MQVCQGDVMIETCDPKRIEGLKPCRPTVALGEMTGHHHTFEGKHALGFYKEGDDMQIAGGSPLADFVQVTGKPSPLKHQEHAPIVHEPSTYERTPQMEWDELAMAPRASAD